MATRRRRKRRPLVAGELSLNEVLKRLGFYKTKGFGPYRHDIRRADGTIVVANGTAGDVWAALHRKGLIA